MLDIKFILAIIIAIVCAGFLTYRFVRLPNEIKIANLKEFLKWATMEAEKELGGGTGALKLRMVYNMCITKFPWIVQLISFDTFSFWVDEALVWTRNQLESNVAIKRYIVEE